MKNKEYEKVDMTTWVRKEIYKYFLDCDEPFHGVTVQIDMTAAKLHTSKSSQSIFSFYMFHYLQSLNESRAFKLRILENEVIEYKEINTAFTVMRDNGIFAFGRIFRRNTLAEFNTHIEEEKQRVKSRGTFRDKESRQDTIHFSVLPWTNFTGLSHARRYSTGDSIPKISFGKIFQEGDKWKMPMSIHVHHSLVDGKDVADFIDNFQAKLNTI